MKTLLIKTDSFLIVFSAFINTVALIITPFVSDMLSIVALIQLFIGAYTILISAPFGLVTLEKIEGQQKKRMIHFLGSLTYITLLFIIMPMVNNEILATILLVAIPQLFLYLYCSFYIIETPFFNSIKTSK